MRIAVAGGTGVAGRVLVRRAVAAGHAVRVLSRSADGSVEPDAERVRCDVVTGDGLDRALDGFEAVVDCTNVDTARREPATRFFVTATRNLIAAEQAVAASQHIVLSVAGIDEFPLGYYQGKLAQEEAAQRAAESGSVRVTIARVTQFHDLARITYDRANVGPVCFVPPMHLQPVHLDDVADYLLELLAAGVGGWASDLAGPAPEELPDMVARYAAQQPKPRRLLKLPLPPRQRRANESMALRPKTPRHGTITFETWLAEQRP